MHGPALGLKVSVCMHGSAPEGVPHAEARVHHNTLTIDRHPDTDVHRDHGDPHRSGSTLTRQRGLSSTPNRHTKNGDNCRKLLDLVYPGQPPGGYRSRALT